MAADWYLATEACKTPILRFYHWSPPALSLGYHQPEAAVNWPACRSMGVDVVRRPTGGRAVLHARELTYAVIIPRDAGCAAGGIHAVHNRISQALARGIRSLGIEVGLEEQAPDFRSHYRGTATGTACFTSAAKYELQIRGKKVVGSAQRLFPQSVLQHGSILLGDAHREIVKLLRLSPAERRQLAAGLQRSTTELKTTAGRPVASETLCRAIEDAWQQQFQCTLDPEPLNQAEEDAIRRYHDHFVLRPDEVPIADHP